MNMITCRVKGDVIYMREILFRGKSIVTDSPNTPGHWLEGNHISRVLDFEDGKTVIEHNIVELNSYINIYLDMCTEVWPETVGQWTGLLDKNGKKIFEGDIVEIDEHDIMVNGFYQVNYSEENHCYALERGVHNHFNHFTFSELNGFANSCEVIGNIHDNPELLKSST